MTKALIHIAAFSALLFASAVTPALADAGKAESGKWYVRADVGASFGDNTDGDLIDAAGNRDVISFDFNSSSLLQVGLGYHINSFLRTDLTVSHRTGFGDSHIFKNGENSTTSDTDADLKSTSAFVSLYLDIAEFKNWDLGKFSPYVGAGIGWAVNDLDDALIKLTQDRFKGDETHNFAFRLTGGTGYSLTDHLILDLAYSYADLGEASSKKSFTDGTGLQLSVQRGIEVDLKTHEITLGLRYSF